MNQPNLYPRLIDIPKLTTKLIASLVFYAKSNDMTYKQVTDFVGLTKGDDNSLTINDFQDPSKLKEKIKNK